MDRRTSLIAGGLVLLVLAAAGWFYTRGSTRTVVVERYSREISKSESEGYESVESSDMVPAASPLPGAPSKRVTTGPTESRTITRPPRKVTKTTTQSAISDTLILGLLGFGSAFILAGAFFDRIAAFKMAGVEVNLVDGAKNLSSTVDEIKAGQETLEEGQRELARVVARLLQPPRRR